MEPREYANLESIEERHWYYAGKREIVRHWLARVAPPQQHHTLLDCGAGTGFFAREMEAQCHILVLDDHEEALRILHTRFQPGQILSLAGDRVPLPDGSLDFVTALDVLEHVPDDAGLIREFHRLLKPGGVAVITVPAGVALWSDWDVALHHHRRYTRSQLRALFPAEAWEVVHANYTNVIVYPAVWCVRKWRGWRRGASGKLARTEDGIPPRWLNSFLRALFVGFARSRIPFPFGVSLLLVARRRGLRPLAESQV
ncbi:MAG: class I SAM-dependent methyltransferase [Opitutus sp.]